MWACTKIIIISNSLRMYLHKCIVWQFYYHKVLPGRWGLLDPWTEAGLLFNSMHDDLINRILYLIVNAYIFTHLRKLIKYKPSKFAYWMVSLYIIIVSPHFISSNAYAKFYVITVAVSFYLWWWMWCKKMNKIIDCWIPIYVLISPIKWKYARSLI